MYGTIAEYCVPVQVDNSSDENKQIIQKYRHVWTPDLRILDGDGFELYRWNGYLPPPEFAGQLLAGLGHARLRRREYEQAEDLYARVLRILPTALAAPEAQYFAAVAAYRKSGESKDLLHGWHELEKTYPRTEWTIKQNFD